MSPAYDDGAAVLTAAAAQGLPGVVARRGDRPADPASPQDPVIALGAVADVVRVPVGTARTVVGTGRGGPRPPAR